MTDYGLTVGTRHKASFNSSEDKVNGKVFIIGRNNEHNPRTGLYISVNGYYGFDVADIPAMIDALKSVQEDFAHPVVENPFVSLKPGSIIRFNGENNVWFKLNSIDWKFSSNAGTINYNNLVDFVDWDYDIEFSA